MLFNVVVRSRPYREGQSVSVNQWAQLWRTVRQFVFGSQVGEMWRFPPRSLRMAREALGLDLGQAYALVCSRTSASPQDVFLWMDLDRPEDVLHTQSEPLAVLVATGIAVHARALGSDRAIADLILFGPTPLSPYPRTRHLQPDSVDRADYRRLLHAARVLESAAKIGGGHDDTIETNKRVTNALSELNRWFQLSDFR